MPTCQKKGILKIFKGVLSTRKQSKQKHTLSREKLVRFSVSADNPHFKSKSKKLNKRLSQSSTAKLKKVESNNSIEF